MLNALRTAARMAPTFYAEVIRYRGASAEVEREIEEHARSQSLRIGRPMVLIGALTAILWWPTDLAYASRPEVIEAFALWRILVVLISLTYYLTAESFAFARRHYVFWATALSMMLVGECAYFAGSVGGADNPWFAPFCLSACILFPVMMRFEERLLATACITGVTILGFFVAHPANLSSAPLTSSLATLAFGVAVALAAGHALYHTSRGSFLKERALQELTRTLSDRVEARTAELRLLARHVETLRENERGAIARELHDELGQILTGMRVELDLADSLRRSGGDVAGQHVRLSELLDSTLAAARSLLSRLRPRVLDDFGLIAALEWLVDDTRRRSDLEITFHAEPPEFDTSPEVATAVFRIVQESLTNVLRHAEAKRVEVRLVLADDALRLTVSDDGRGLAPPEERRPASMGLVGMRERATALGGTFELGPNAPRGTVVAIRLPQRRPEQVAQAA